MGFGVESMGVGVRVGGWVFWGRVFLGAGWGGGVQVLGGWCLGCLGGLGTGNLPYLVAYIYGLNFIEIASIIITERS